MAKDIHLSQNGVNLGTNSRFKIAEPGREATIHRLRLRILWQLGEVELIPTKGIDYLGAFREKPALVDLLASEISNELRRDEAVVRVEDTTVEFPASEDELRKMNYETTVLIDEEEEITVSGSFEI